MSFVIIKNLKIENTTVPVIIVDSHSEILEFNTEVEAVDFANILAANSISESIYQVKKI